MATRPLTQTFLALRFQASQRRTDHHSTHSYDGDDAAHLIPSSPDHVRVRIPGGASGAAAGSGVGAGGKGAGIAPVLQPDWVDVVDRVKSKIKEIGAEIKELKDKHNKHIHKPDFEDNLDEEQMIEIMTAAITSKFHDCQSDIKRIGSMAEQSASPDEIKMSRNVKSALALELQTLSSEFRKAQSNYLKKLKQRAEGGIISPDIMSSTKDNDDDELPIDHGFTEEQLAQMQESISFSRQREEEINKLVASINDLASIFKDLAEMIYDQGTILDRIDHNIDQALTCVVEGEKELVTAEKYQKSSQKKICIILLIVVIIAMVVALILTK